MQPYDVLLTLHLDTGTERFSLFGTQADAGVYEDRLSSIGTIERKAGRNGGRFSISNGRARIKDSDRKLKRLSKRTPFRNRLVEVHLADRATGDITQAYSGKIQGTGSDYSGFEIDFRDPAIDVFGEDIPLSVTPELFQYLPNTTPADLIPIVCGSAKTANYRKVGAVPAYLVDPKVGGSKYKYVASQIALKENSFTVYRFGKELPSSEYTVTYENVTTEFGTVLMTFLNFDRDQRDAQSMGQLEITFDCDGMTDDGTSTGTVITSPVDQLEAILTLRGRVSDSDFDTTLTAAAATAYAAESIQGSVVISGRRQTYAQVIDQFSRSFNLSLFRTAAGKWGMFFDNAAASGSSDLPHLSDNEKIVEGSWSSGQINNAVSEIKYGYAWNGTSGDFDAIRLKKDSSEETDLGEAIRETQDMPYLRDAGQAETMAEIKLWHRREERRLIAFDIPADPTLELGDYVEVTHFAGETDDEVGYDRDEFRIYGIGLDADRDGVFYRLDLVDHPGFTPGVPSDSDGPREASTIPEDSRDITTDIEFTSTDNNTVSWTAGTIRLLPSGTEFPIGAGNTGNMAGLTWIYFDAEISTTALQTETTFANLGGNRQWILAIAKVAANSNEDAPLSVRYGFHKITSSEISDNSITGSTKIRTGTVVEGNLAADSVTAGKIAADAVVADKIAAGAIDGFVITGATMRTSATDPRIEMNSSNFRSYDVSGNVLVEIPTSGNVGMIVLTASDTVPGKIVFGSVAEIFSGTGTSESTAFSILPQSTGKILRIGSASDDWGQILFNASSGISFDGSGVNFGAAGPRIVPGSNEIRALGAITSILKVSGGASSTASGVILYDQVGGNKRFEVNLTGIGFFGATPAAKPEITGSRGGNAALADLLTELATLGLLTDSTT